jgi:hypothetical protein
LQRDRERITVGDLNHNHNHDLKNVFKSAAISPSHCPLREFYVALVEKGMRHRMSRLILGRKMASITLTFGRKGVDFNAKQLHQQAASESRVKGHSISGDSRVLVGRVLEMLGFEGTISQ